MAPKSITLAGIPGGVSQCFNIFVWGGGGEGIAPATISSEVEFEMLVNPFYFGTSGLFTFTPGTIASLAIYSGSSTWASGEVTIYGALEPSSGVLALVGLVALVARRHF